MRGGFIRVKIYEIHEPLLKLPDILAVRTVSLEFSCIIKREIGRLLFRNGFFLRVCDMLGRQFRDVFKVCDAAHIRIDRIGCRFGFLNIKILVRSAREIRVSRAGTEEEDYY